LVMSSLSRMMFFLRRCNLLAVASSS
jgi:hypothetical protein